MYYNNMKQIVSRITYLAERQCSDNTCLEIATYLSMMRSLLRESLVMVENIIDGMDLETQVLEADVLLLCERVENLGLVPLEQITMIKKLVMSQCWLSSTKTILEEFIEEHDLRMTNSKMHPEFDDDEMLKRPE